eukprot:TRINITY_DN2087_c0_g1_i9.p1 TRINITY_DN2087_c0_g1~~TRINITY_DN2087_c0_g1_i9.p1  ORF type:complete len:123 (+),score=19.61 TRINITY_DN2087_c0_g1_i9:25-369(+)
MIRRPPRSTHCISSAASDVYKRQVPFLLLLRDRNSYINISMRFISEEKQIGLVFLFAGVWFYFTGLIFLFNQAFLIIANVIVSLTLACTFDRMGMLQESELRCFVLCKQRQCAI